MVHSGPMVWWGPRGGFSVIVINAALNVLLTCHLCLTSDGLHCYLNVYIFLDILEKPNTAQKQQSHYKMKAFSMMLFPTVTLQPPSRWSCRSLSGPALHTSAGSLGFPASPAYLSTANITSEKHPLQRNMSDAFICLYLIMKSGCDRPVCRLSVDLFLLHLWEGA